MGANLYKTEGSSLKEALWEVKGWFAYNLPPSVYPLDTLFFSGSVPVESTAREEIDGTNVRMTLREEVLAGLSTDLGPATLRFSAFHQREAGTGAGLGLSVPFSEHIALSTRVEYDPDKQLDLGLGLNVTFLSETGTEPDHRIDPGRTLRRKIRFETDRPAGSNREIPDSPPPLFQN